MIRRAKNVAWLEWFRLRLPHFVPVSFALVDGLILLHAASYRLNDLTGAWQKLISFSRKLQSYSYCVYLDSVEAERCEAVISSMYTCLIIVLQVRSLDVVSSAPNAIVTLGHVSAERHTTAQCCSFTLAGWLLIVVTYLVVTI